MLPCFSSSSSSYDSPIDAKDLKTKRISAFANYYIKTFLALTILCFYVGAGYCFSRSMEVTMLRQKQFLLGAGALFAFCGTVIAGSAGFEWSRQKNKETLFVAESKQTSRESTSQTQTTEQTKLVSRKNSSVTESDITQLDAKPREFEEMMTTLETMPFDLRVIIYQEILTRWPEEQEKITRIVERISQDVSQWAPEDVQIETKKAYADLVERCLRTDLIDEDIRWTSCRLPLPYTVEQWVYLYSLAQTAQQRETCRSSIPANMVQQFEEAMIRQHCEVMHQEPALQYFIDLEDPIKVKVVKAWIAREGGIEAMLSCEAVVRYNLYRYMDESMFFDFIKEFQIGNGHQQYENAIQELCHENCQKKWLTVSSLLEKSHEIPEKSNVLVYFAGIKMSCEVMASGGDKRILENLIEQFPKVPQGDRDLFLNIIFNCKKIEKRILERFNFPNHKMVLKIGGEERTFKDGKDFFQKEHARLNNL